ncbi:hypothetical protein AURDEDRAFT_165045 [Auricularia subglabra TFB-10046 SS5]|nr:hypothetical protein AURDEDRAFT_165045 [Auricularia subglabra TFB-10046 SS5]
MSAFPLVVKPRLKGSETLLDCGVKGFTCHMMQQALEGVRFLHANGITHGQLLFID